MEEANKFRDFFKTYGGSPFIVASLWLVVAVLTLTGFQEVTFKHNIVSALLLVAVANEFIRGIKRARKIRALIDEEVKSCKNELEEQEEQEEDLTALGLSKELEEISQSLEWYATWPRTPWWPLPQVRIPLESKEALILARCLLRRIERSQRIVLKVSPPQAESSLMLLTKLKHHMSGTCNRIVNSMKPPQVSARLGVRYFTEHCHEAHESYGDALKELVVEFECEYFLAGQRQRGENREGDGVDDSLKKAPRILKAYQTYQYALERVGKAAATYKELYKYLEENGYPGDDEYDLPSLESWATYVRTARRYLGEQKNTPRAGRSHGSSIVEADQIEYKSGAEAG